MHRVAPQCREEQKWVNIDWTVSQVSQPVEPSEEMAALFELIESLLKSGKIDPDRVYITGLSMVGFGTWDAICRHPTVFAAAVPIWVAEIPNMRKL